MFLVLGNMSGRWFVATSHSIEEEAWKIATKQTDATGHKHIVTDEKTNALLYKAN